MASAAKKSGESSWVRVQEKAFTAWMNETVQKRNMQVSDLRTDLESGLTLINFFEILCGHPLGEKFEKKPSQRIQKINNIHLALRFLERDMGVRNPGCSAEDIIDAETKGIKLILGLLWTLFRKYRMKVDLGDDKKKGREEDMLLEWVRSVIAAHGMDPSQVQSFRTSFNDGQVFLALAKIYDGEAGQIPYEEAKKGTATEVLNAAFEYAERSMGVNKLLDASEVADGSMDERALALYTSLFYHAFKTKEELARMQQSLGQSAFQLELEHKGKDELIRMNYDLNETIAKTKAELAQVQETSESTHRELVEARERIEELEQQLATRDAEITALKQQLSDVEAARNAEMVKRQASEEAVKGLTAQLEASHVLCEEEKEKRIKAEAQIAQLRNELDALTERLRIETAAKEGGVRDLTDKLSTETQRVKELTEQQAAQVQQTEQLSSEVAELRTRLKREQKTTSTKERQLTESRDQSRLNVSGLAVLRTNLDAHISDLHRWQKFLEGRVADVQDPVEEVERVREELEKLSFQEQLNLLSTHLQEENVAMTRILKERAKEKAAAEKPATASAAGDEKKKKEKDKGARKPHHTSKKDKAEGSAPAAADTAATPAAATATTSSAETPAEQPQQSS